MVASRLSLVFLLLALAVLAEAFPSFTKPDWLTFSQPPLSTDDGGLSELETCHGNKVGDCINGDEENMMDSESSRRALAQARRYISYAALKKNSVPCNRRGNSYYSNCASRKRANPYNRGCSKITHCRRYTDI